MNLDCCYSDLRLAAVSLVINVAISHLNPEETLLSPVSAPLVHSDVKLDSILDSEADEFDSVLSDVVPVYLFIDSVAIINKVLMYVKNSNQGSSIVKIVLKLRLSLEL